MRILSIESDDVTARLLKAQLEAEGMDCTTIDLGEKGIRLAKTNAYDAILLDLGLLDMSGLDVLRALRVAKMNTPIIIVSGVTDIETKVKTFGGGADDYIAKPYNRLELIARVQSVVRRSQGLAQPVVTIGALVVSPAEKRIEANGVRIHLTGKEYGLLEHLIRRRGMCVSKESLLAHLYGDIPAPPAIKIIDVFVCKIRKKLAVATSGAQYIETVWGGGYILRDPTDSTGITA